MMRVYTGGHVQRSKRKIETHPCHDCGAQVSLKRTYCLDCACVRMDAAKRKKNEGWRQRKTVARAAT